MSTPTELVERFCAAFTTADVDTIASLLADDVVYHNVGMAPAVGKEASLAMIQGFLDMAETMTFEVHRIAVNVCLQRRRKRALPAKLGRLHRAAERRLGLDLFASVPDPLASTGIIQGG